MFALFYHLLSFALLALATCTPPPHCKAIPGTSTWPSPAAWNQLNASLSGSLIATVPPGAVCHPTQPSYDPLTCAVTQAGWLTTDWHTGNPVSTLDNNWNNDTCLPIPEVKCDGKGYPVYVVNASCAGDVKSGVDFARKEGVRLVVKGTGHDYLGRSVAPNSLSIWTHHMRGLEFHDDFKPKGCRYHIDGPAIKAAAGTQMRELNEQAHLKNLTIMSGGSGSVGVGGYITGGGHSALSSTYGLAADQVLEMEVVTPGGAILTVNECQNQDLFWAMRGGGGSTFGVMTSVTIKAFPSTPCHVANFLFGTAPNSAAYWDVMAYILSKHPELADQGISGYNYLAPGFLNPEKNITSPVDAYGGGFMLQQLHLSNTSTSLESTISKLFADATVAYPGQFFSTVTMKSFPDFWGWYSLNSGPHAAGGETVLGSRLIDEDTLTRNLTALKEAYKVATPPGQLTMMLLVGGKGVRNAKPRGGSNSVNPVWRKASIHSIVTARWKPFDTTEEKKQKTLLNDVHVEALRKLTPDSGAYINEAYADEPDFQHAFWGENYERLLAIKKKVDPNDVLWCHPCVGNEGWEVVDGVLCKK